VSGYPGWDKWVPKAGQVTEKKAPIRARRTQPVGERRPTAAKARESGAGTIPRTPSVQHKPTCHLAVDEAGEYINCYRPLGGCTCGAVSRPSKYRNQKTTVDGVTFDSKREADRYQALMLEMKAGQIAGLELQPRFALHVYDAKGALRVIGEYRADFAYINPRSKVRVIEDAKGMRTALYKWKKKHVEAEYGVLVVEV
jgi:hypothetical protein